MRHFKGENYDSNLTTKEIAKTIRQFVRKEFKNCKFSVTSTYNTINATLISSDNETRKYSELKGRSIFTAYGQEVYDKINSLMKSFLRDYSDVTTDYSDVNFYGFINIQ